MWKGYLERFWCFRVESLAKPLVLFFAVLCWAKNRKAIPFSCFCWEILKRIQEPYRSAAYAFTVSPQPFQRFHFTWWMDRWGETTKKFQSYRQGMHLILCWCLVCVIVLQSRFSKTFILLLQSYIEPETGNKFRSMAAVERYLQAVGNGTVDSVSMVQSNRLAVSFLSLQKNEVWF